MKIVIPGMCVETKFRRLLFFITVEILRQRNTQTLQPSFDFI